MNSIAVTSTVGLCIMRIGVKLLPVRSTLMRRQVLVVDTESRWIDRLRQVFRAAGGCIILAREAEAVAVTDAFKRVKRVARRFVEL